MARIISLVVLLAILAVLGVLFFQVMASFLLPCFLAVLLVVVFSPVHRWFVARCKGRNRLAAGLTTAVIMLIVLIPVALLTVKAVQQSIAVYPEIKKFDVSKVAAAVNRVSERIGVNFSAADLQKTLTSNLQRWLEPVAVRTPQVIMQWLVGLFVMVIALYYFLADGPNMVQGVARLLPIDQRYTQRLLDQFVSVSRAVVLATLLSAGIQGLLAGAALYLAGFPSVLLWMVVATLLAMVPFLGPPCFWIPACLWLYLYEGRTTAAIVMAVWAVIVLSTVDNIVKPLVLHGRSNLHPLLALLSVLGGMQALGPIGIVVGPMAVAFLQTILNVVHDELRAMQKDGAKPKPAGG